MSSLLNRCFYISVLVITESLLSGLVVLVLFQFLGCWISLVLGRVIEEPVVLPFKLFNRVVVCWLEFCCLSCLIVILNCCEISCFGFLMIFG